MKPTALSGIRKLFLPSLQPLIISALVLPSTQLIAQPIPSEPQFHEWTEPQTDVKIVNSDKYIEYKRDGRTVFRTIERNVTVDSKQLDPSGNKVTNHIIEFIADGKILVSVGLKKGSVLSCNVISGEGIYFSSGFVGLTGKRAFYVCVPKLDYFEYLEITDTEVKLIPDTAESYAVWKRAIVKIAEAGSFHQDGEMMPSK